MAKHPSAQALANARVPLPVKDGVAASYLWLDQPLAGDLLGYLALRFPEVGIAVWRDRMVRAEVVAGDGSVLAPDSALPRGTRIWYYREVDVETPIPFEEQILFRDEHLVVVDKPHFLTMTPAGRFLRETLLVRLKNKLGLEHLTPIHRLDRETAGVVIFSHCLASRGAYASLFQQRRVEKEYEALAGPMPGRTFPFTYRSRMVEGTPFFRMQEEAGEQNSETLVDLIGAQDAHFLYRLRPHSGRKHQLRVHMAALGAPILNDAFYPDALACKGDDFAHPLQLLARSIAFADPLTGQRRQFASLRQLGAQPASN